MQFRKQCREHRKPHTSIKACLFHQLLCINIPFRYVFSLIFTVLTFRKSGYNGWKNHGISWNFKTPYLYEPCIKVSMRENSWIFISIMKGVARGPRFLHESFKCTCDFVALILCCFPNHAFLLKMTGLPHWRHYLLYTFSEWR